jgi:hypothetical protein
MKAKVYDVPFFLIACRKNDDVGWTQTNAYLYPYNNIIYTGTRWCVIQCPTHYLAAYQGGRLASGLRGGLVTYDSFVAAALEATALEAYG